MTASHTATGELNSGTDPPNCFAADDSPRASLAKVLSRWVGENPERPGAKCGGERRGGAVVHSPDTGEPTRARVVAALA